MIKILKYLGIQPKGHPSCTFTYWVHPNSPMDTTVWDGKVNTF